MGEFQFVPDNLEIYYPDGNKFLTSVEFDQLAKQERQEKEIAIQQYQELLTKLQENGIDLEYGLHPQPPQARAKNI
jgi:hypothetical protein